MSELNEVEQMFEQVEPVEGSVLDPKMETNKKPKLGDVEWTDYVLSFLQPNEVVDNKGQKLPKTDGLRRICNQIMGEIIYSKSLPPNVFMTDRGLVSVVTHELKILRGDGQLIEIGGVADCREDCLTAPFNQYVTANASTKAMGRAFRDAMQLQVLVAEELNNRNDLIVVDSEESEDLQPITSAQIAGIKSLCKRLKIDLQAFINQGSFKYDKLEKVLIGTAKGMMALLNSYQNGKEVPEEIKLK